MLAWIFWFRGNLLAQAVAGVIALLGVWKINNLSVARKTIKNIVATSQQAGRNRNDKSRQIRNDIDPRTAMQRLRREFAHGN